MKNTDRAQAAVIGAGTMGRGIAQVFAQAGFRVSLQDASGDALKEAQRSIEQSLKLMQGLDLIPKAQAGACLGRISFETGLEQACQGAGLVLESIPEDIELKRGLYRAVEDLVPSQTVIGTNTSALSITSLAEGMRHPKRFVGVHFWNPAQVMPCVEVVKGRDTSGRVFDNVVSILNEAGKKPVRVLKDVPGFLGNRLQHALQREALYLVEAGIAEPRDVDAVVKHGFGLRYAFMGPLERADLGGLDVTCAVQRYLLKDLDGRTKASPLLEQRVARGDLGVKTGRGFYDWDSGKASEAAQKRDLALLSIIKLLRSLEEGS